LSNEDPMFFFFMRGLQPFVSMPNRSGVAESSEFF
jgi:hypothetical protein